jgi:RecB family endonuclease NucS
MKFAGGLVKHLGLQMYSGAVPSIAELIANSWDADATEVSVKVPLDKPITDDLEVWVQDDGCGMTFDEVDERYLVLGRDRRRFEGDFTDGGRRALGRKGIGKLAGFGIASIVEVWTVRDKQLTAFEMNYEDITKAGSAEMVEPYAPTILADRPVSGTDPIQSGTLVKLKRLQIRNAVNGERFRQSMTRRFALLSTSFKVTVNGTLLKREKMPLQFRYPKTGLNAVEVPGLGTVQWWAGFTEKPITVDEARGIAVLSHGKLVQAPFFFEMSGGASGQHGLQYLTGEVLADMLDEEIDLIATDRSSVLWEDPRAEPLLTWGQSNVRTLLRDWSARRHKANTKRLRDTTPYMAMVARFPEREQKELVTAIDTLAAIDTITQERLDELVAILIRAFENDTFMNLIRALNAAEEKDHETIATLIDEWDIIEAISTAQMVRGRVEIIRTFDGMIKAGVPEKPDMQDYVMAHPWLLDPGWDVLEHERSLDKVLAEKFGVEKTKSDDGRKRLDFFCLADSSMAVVVEVKRPGDTIGLKELGQLEEYVDFLATWNDQSTGDQRRYREVKGCLIYSKMRQDAMKKRDRLAEAGMAVVTWDGLLHTAERLHKEFLEVVKSRAPQDDPRIEALGDLSEGDAKRKRKAGAPKKAAPRKVAKKSAAKKKAAPRRVGTPKTTARVRRGN